MRTRTRYHIAVLLGYGLLALALTWPEEKRIEKLRNFLSVAEFLARETRTGGDE